MPTPMQRERRRDPYPWTWEIPVAIVLVALAVLVLGIQLGRSVGNLAAGAGWTWPDTDTGMTVASPVSTAFWSSLPEVLAGDAAAGLPNPLPAAPAGRALLWVSICLVELGLLGMTGWAGASIYSRWGPGRMRGMATASEAERLLGVTRLRRVAPIVRPDLYGAKAAGGSTAPTHRTAVTTEPGTPSSQLGRGLSNPWLPERQPDAQPHGPERGACEGRRRAWRLRWPR